MKSLRDHITAHNQKEDESIQKLSQWRIINKENSTGKFINGTPVPPNVRPTIFWEPQIYEQKFSFE
jgi:hypothetical protein